MKTSSLCAPWIGALMAVGAVLASHASAHAQNCATDVDCPDHMACQAQTSWVCDGGGPADAGVAGSGEAGAGGTSGTSGTSGTGDTGGSGGSGDMDPCEDGGCEPPTCEEVPAESLCVPRYQLPCETASDCGGGFECVEDNYWECSGGSAGGSGGTGAGDAGTAGAAGGEVMPGEDPGAGGSAGDESVCVLVPSGTSSCVLQDIACEVHADCPSGLECLEQYVYPPCMGGDADAGIVGGAGGVSGTSGAGSGGDGDGDMGGSGGDPIVCPDPEVQLRCMPPWDGGGTGGSGGSMGGGDADAGSEDPTGSGGSAGAGGASGTGTGSAGTGSENGDEDDGADEGGHHLGHLIKRLLRGCSTTGPTTSEGSMSGFWMLGLAALALRRRVRKS